MTGLCIEDLPPPPAGRTGWPWTEAALPLATTLPNNVLWPKVSVVTPSYNQGDFLERTIRSVLLQGYPQLEYIVIDGASSDESLGIIERYAQYLAYWVSEPDRGNYHAINKGFARSTGEIICWLNSDDFFLPHTLSTVAENLNRGTGEFAIVGDVIKIYVDGRPAERLAGRYQDLARLLKFWLGYQMHQSSIFWRREVFEVIGLLDEEKSLIADFDYWVRIAKHFGFKNVGQTLSCTTFHDKAKTGDNYHTYHQELKREAPSYWGSPYSAAYWCMRVSMANHLILKPLSGRFGEPVKYYALAAQHHIRRYLGRNHRFVRKT